MGQVRGPCKVRAKGCKGVAASENAEHPTWKWRNAKNAGEIKAGDKDYGGAETAWDAGTEDCVVDVCGNGACKRLSGHETVHQQPRTKAAGAAAGRARGAAGRGAADERGTTCGRSAVTGGHGAANTATGTARVRCAHWPFGRRCAPLLWRCAPLGRCAPRSYQHGKIAGFTEVDDLMVVLWPRILCTLSLAVVTSTQSGSAWDCVSTIGVTNQSSEFCRGVPVPSPGACVDDGSYVANQRTEKSYIKQQGQCSTAHKRREVCPNDPSHCVDDVFNKSTWCGQYDQACDLDLGASSCLPYCWTDCFPCNDQSDCSLLVDFGVAAPAGAPCFSLEGRPIPPALLSRAREQRRMPPPRAVNNHTR